LKGEEERKEERQRVERRGRKKERGEIERKGRGGKLRERKKKRLYETK